MGLVLSCSSSAKPGNPFVTQKDGSSSGRRIVEPQDAAPVKTPPEEEPEDDAGRDDAGKGAAGRDTRGSDAGRTCQAKREIIAGTEQRKFCKFGVKGSEMLGHVGPEVFGDPLTGCMDFSLGIIGSGDQQRGDFEQTSVSCLT